MSVAMHREDVIGADEALALHEGFVRSRALRWVAKLPHLDMHIDDLMQEGRIGLWQGLQKFDPTRGVELLTYAGKWVDNLMRNFVERRSHLVRFGRGREISMVWLDAPMDGDEEFTLHGLLAAPESDDAWELDDRHARLMQAVSRLREVERRVVEECLIKGRVQRDVAQEMGCSRTWVQQLLDKAMKSLRRALHVSIETDANLDGWVPLRQWLAEEGQKRNVSGGAVRAQIERGVRPMPETKRVKGRIFVRGMEVPAVGESSSEDTLKREQRTQKGHDA